MNDMNKWLESERKKKDWMELFSAVIFVVFVLGLCALYWGLA